LIFLGDFTYIVVMAKSLLKLRQEIDDIDSRILKLLNKRARTAIDIGLAKQKGKKQTYVPDREHKILNKIVSGNKGEFPSQALRNVYREVLSACRSLQSPIQVAYLGPEATFTQSAALKHFGQSTQMLPQSTINAVFEAVESGDIKYGVVPIENSTEGVVTHTLDRLMESPLKICGEVLLEISHCLLGIKKGIIPEQIYSHPQATAQCRDWLDRHYPDVNITHVPSTARAAQLAAQDTKAYAIGSELAASRYSLKLLKKSIEDHRHNITRFLVLGTESPKRSGDDKTSIVFSVKDRVGILFQMLKPFYKAGINLSKIESRPMMRLDSSKVKSQANQGRWEYAFFIDLEGHIQSPKLKKAVDELEHMCLYLKVLGSYPRGK
jgi:chorismate mutase/prephenate dehydratase